MEVGGQGTVDQLTEFFMVMVQHLSSFLKGQALGAVAAVVGNVTGGLVGEQVDMDVVVYSIFQQVHDISVEGDGHGLFPVHIGPGCTEGLLRRLADHFYPALAVAGLDPGGIHLGDDAHASGDLDGLGLCAAHAAQSAGDE